MFAPITSRHSSSPVGMAITSSIIGLCVVLSTFRTLIEIVSIFVGSGRHGSRTASLLGTVLFGGFTAALLRMYAGLHDRSPRARKAAIMLGAILLIWCVWTPLFWVDDPQAPDASELYSLFIYLFVPSGVWLITYFCLPSTKREFSDNPACHLES